MRNTRQTLQMDCSPLFRSGVGFDRMMRLMEDIPKTANQSSYPPYNIERINDDSYVIQLAVAGFAEADLDIQAEGNQLRVTGHKNDKDEDNRDYLHRGIALRNFEQRFHLADHIEVKHAHLHDGMLMIDLIRNVPEQLKPRKVAITAAKSLLGKNK